MAYTFEQVFAADPANPSNIAQNASITIFAPGDGTMTPIAITDPDGQALANPIPVNANGFGSAFMADIDRVAWLGGGFTGFFTSYEGMKEVAVASQAAAETAASTAGAEAVADVEARIAAGEFKGEKGDDGANVLPTDTAIKQAIDNPASETRGALNATYGRPILKVEQYGNVDITGVTDSSAAVIAANNDAVAKGAILEFPRGTIRINSQIVFPQTAGKQKSVRWTGQGRSTNWGTDGGTGGTILDLRYAGAGHKIETYGQGLLEIDHLTLADDGTSTTPYLLTVGTTLHVHDIAVTGNPSKSRFTCDQDVFILGGLEGTTENNGPTHAFQGYGTVIERVLFEKVRTGVRLRRFANSVIVADLSFSNRCGSTGNESAIEIDPGTGAAVEGGEPAAFAYGNIIRDCLIEVMGYVYGIRLLNKSEHNIIRGCSFWDADDNVAYLADLYFDATATANVITDPGVQTQNKSLVDVSGQNYWSGPMFGSTGYVQTVVGGNQGMFHRGSIKVRDTDSFTVQDTAGVIKTRLNQGGLEMRNDAAVRGADTGGVQRALLSVTASNQIMVGDVLNAFSNQSVIINAASTSFIRARIAGVDKIQVSTAGVGFNGSAPAKPTLTYSRTGESAAEAALRAALTTLGLVTDSTVA